LIFKATLFVTSAGYEEVYWRKRDLGLGPKTGSNFSK